MQQKNKTPFFEGINDGIPICLGYFFTALAFGILCRQDGLNFVESVLFSATNLAGAGQFLALNFMNATAFVSQVALAVFLINLRYFFMSAAISTRLDTKGLKRGLVAFGTTDEIFSVSMLRSSPPDFPYMEGLEIISFLGWTFGTAVGFIIGKFLPYALQIAAGITLYSMFVSLITQEVKRDIKKLIPVLTGASLNCLLYFVFHLDYSWSFIISMFAGTITGALTL